MKTGNYLIKIILAASLAILIAACGGGGGGGGGASGGGGGGGGTITPPPSLLFIMLTTASSSLPKGMSEQYIATGSYSDGTLKNLTALATWSSASAAVATTPAGGVATAISPGSTTITASYGGMTSFGSPLSVTSATLKSIAITPASPTLAAAQPKQLTATGTFSDGSTLDITSGIWWVSSNYSIATVNSTTATPTGLATGIAPGVATITAMDPNTGIQASDTLTVSGFAVSGALWYLPAGASIGLLDNGTDALTVTNTTAAPSANLPYMFNAGVASGNPYNVTVSSQPAGAPHTCYVVDGTGMMAASAVYNVDVVCGTATATLAGTPRATGTANGTGTAASFYNPSGVAYDAKTGNVYIADTANHVIRMVTPAGVVTTVAGTMGLGGFVNGTGTSASFFNPAGLAVDTAGNIYVADTGNNAIRKIAMPGATVSTLAGSGAAGATNSPTGSSATFNQPAGVSVDSSNNVYVADSGNNVIRKVTSTGATTTFAGVASVNCGGFVNGSVTTATFCSPQGVVTDSTATNVYVADTRYQQIRRISGGSVSTVAGSPSLFPGYADGAGTAASFSSPIGIVLDASGNLYIGDCGNSAVRKITAPATTATVTTYAMGSAIYADGPAWVAGSIYSSSFNSLKGVTLNPTNGYLYVADTSNHLIRVIMP